MQKSFDSKLDKMRIEFMATPDGKTKCFRGKLDMNLNKESERIDTLERMLHTVKD